MNPLDRQVGGTHYQRCKIQPIEYALANGLGPCETNIVKYATRWKWKNGVEDLKKIIHYVEILIKDAEDRERETAKSCTTAEPYSQGFEKQWLISRPYDPAETD